VAASETTQNELENLDLCDQGDMVGQFLTRYGRLSYEPGNINSRDARKASTARLLSGFFGSVRRTCLHHGEHLWVGPFLGTKVKADGEAGNGRHKKSHPLLSVCYLQSSRLIADTSILAADSNVVPGCAP
jgi:hypothetical protein